MAHNRPQMNILFLTKSGASASIRYRATQFLPHLKQIGWNTTHLTSPKSIFDWYRLFQTASSADVVVVVRKLFPIPIQRLLRQVSKKLVFDFDDAIYCHDSGLPSPGRQTRFASMVSQCDEIWCGNSYLQNQALRFGASTVILPTSMDVTKYSTHAFDRQADPNEPLDLVWIGQSGNRSLLEALCPTLDRFAEQVPHARLKIISDFTLQTNVIPVVPIAWTEETEAIELASSSIGLAPMQDNEWTRGKCACRVLQYHAAGLPVISSDVPLHREILQPDRGLIARNEEEWQRALMLLAESHDRRRKIGRAGQEFVTSEMSLESVFERMQGRLTVLTTDQPRRRTG